MKTIYFEKNIPKILISKFAAKYCKPLLFTGLNPVKLDTALPDPPLPAADWVRVQNIACGVCGTDLSFFKSTTGTSVALEPMPGSERTYLGHETVGRVMEIGPAVTKFKVGDRVTLVEYMSGCGNKAISPPCRFCQEGNYCLCENYGEPSPLKLPDVGAGFGDTFVAPEQQLGHVRDDISDEDAVMIEPTAVSLHAVLMAPPKPGERVMVLGCGAIGLGVVQSLRIMEPTCHIAVMERVKSRQDLALSLGANEVLSGDPYEAVAKSTGGKVYNGMMKNRMLMGGFDRIYDCVGTKWAFHNALRWLRARGTLVKVGHHMCPTAYDETPIWWQELTIVGIDAHGMEQYEGRSVSTFDLAQELIAKGTYRLEGFVTHRMPLSQYKDAFRLMMENPPELVKIVLQCE